MIELPDGISPQVVEPRYIDFGFFSDPVLGGAIQRTNRKGNRFGLDITLPPVTNKTEGRVLVSRLIQAKSQGLRFTWPQAGFSAMAAGSPVIDGDDQEGTSLDLSGLNAGTIIREGQFFSFEQSGRSYLHLCTAEAQADGSGLVTLSIEPELRVLTVDGSAVLLENPVVDGIVEGDEWRWEMMLSHHLGLSFTLKEQY